MDAAIAETTDVTPPPAAAEPAAPAETTKPQSFRAVDDARIAKALGRSAPAAPAVEAPVSTTPVITEPEGDEAPAKDSAGQPIVDAKDQPLTRRQREAAEQERRTREAVERATAGLREQIEALKRGTTTADPQTPPPAATPAAAVPAKPKMADFEARIGVTGGYTSYAEAVEAFQDARDTWRDDLAAHQAAEREAAEAKSTAARTIADLVEGHRQREQAIVASTPTYFDQTRSIREALKLDSPLTQALLRSPHSADLLLHFATHDDELQRIGTLGLSDLPAAYVALGKLEALYDLSPTAATAAAPVLPKKTVTSAPEPPTTLGTRPAEPANAEHAAIAAKDFRAFDELRVAQALAKRRRR